MNWVDKTKHDQNLICYCSHFMARLMLLFNFDGQIDAAVQL